MKSVDFLSAIVIQTFPLTPSKIASRFIGPRALCNSLPKSGTHLLIRALSLLNLTRVPREHLRFRLSDRDLRYEFSRIGRGQFQVSHLYWDDKLVKQLRQIKIRPIHIIRDPRDVVVSYTRSILNYEASFAEMAVRYLSRGWATKRNVTYDYFRSLNNDEERLMEVITGAPIVEEPFTEGIDLAIESYLPWLEEELCCVVRFENLVGPNGGGSRGAQINEIEKIAFHLGMNVSPDDVDYIAAKVFSPRTTTFRKGVIGDWRNHFSEKHKTTFKKRAGDLLVKLGYEANLEW